MRIFYGWGVDDQHTYVIKKLKDFKNDYEKLFLNIDNNKINVKNINIIYKNSQFEIYHNNQLLNDLVENNSKNKTTEEELPDNLSKKDNLSKEDDNLSKKDNLLNKGGQKQKNKKTKKQKNRKQKIH